MTKATKFKHCRYKAGPGPRFDALVKDLVKHKIKVQSREHERVRSLIEFCVHND